MQNQSCAKRVQIGTFPRKEKELERFVPVLGFEKFYEVSNLGRVRNIRSGLFLKGEKMAKGGYNRLSFSVDGKRTRIMRHIVVIESFGFLKPSPEHQVNHKNGDTSDNSLDNLEWVTCQENIEHREKELTTQKDRDERRERMSQVGKRYGRENGKKSSKPVCCIDPKTKEVLKVYESARAAGEDGFNYKNISQVCLGEKKTHKKFIWKFLSELESATTIETTSEDGRE